MISIGDESFSGVVKFSLLRKVIELDCFSLFSYKP